MHLLSLLVSDVIELSTFAAWILDSRFSFSNFGISYLVIHVSFVLEFSCFCIIDKIVFVIDCLEEPSLMNYLIS